MKNVGAVFLLISSQILFLTACARNDNSIIKNENMLNYVRQPAVAGQFYPGDAKSLKQKIESYLAEATTTSPNPPLVKGRDNSATTTAAVNPPAPSPRFAGEAGLSKGGNNGNPPNPLYPASAKATADKQGGIKAMMVPHAGYDYSGPVAAYGYQAVSGEKVDTVILIGNSHQAYFPGLAIDANDAWQTPLGEVAVNKELADKLITADNDLKYNSQPHEKEHSLEVQLPFLQTVLASGFKIVPILFGNSGDEAYKKLAKALADNLGDEDLVVISTDMSHYPKYEDANKIDKATLDVIRSLDVEALNKHIELTEKAGYDNEQTLICGVDGVKTIIALAKQKSWTANILKYANSGDATIGSKDQVVGYGAMTFASSEKLKVKSAKSEAEIYNLNLEQKDALLEIARTTVEGFVKNGQVPDFKISDERLQQKQGAFVTLKKDGELRGCIGQIIPSENSLWQVVRNMAVAAASEDPRFLPVSAAELPKIEYEVSVLSVPEIIDDWRKIELGKHGVIIKKGWHSGVFLPQVATETGWSLEEFLSQLAWQKAGLSPDAYKNDKGVELQVFTASVF